MEGRRTGKKTEKAGFARVFSSRKAFISGVASEWFALLLIAIIFVLLFIAFRFGVAQEQRSVEDIRDITQGNYIAQVYLRSQVPFGEDEVLSMAELIELYDHERTQRVEDDEDAGEGGLLETAEEMLAFFANAEMMLLGEENELQRVIVTNTQAFVRKNFPQDKCYFFGIHGEHMDINFRGTSCSAARTFSIYYLFSQLEDVDAEVFKTYVAPVDPRDDPIVIYSVYDFERVLAVYSDDPYFATEGAERLAYDAMCRIYFYAPPCALRGIDSAEAAGRELGRNVRRTLEDLRR
ncbi:hypothetical protein KY362_01090 [Candidatus Woesearchaeota archaeon]|nr:hypothetical protein [Candidatus Woesearchaeota archaeon]